MRKLWWLGGYLVVASIVAAAPLEAASTVACRMEAAASKSIDAAIQEIGPEHDLDYGSFRWLVIDSDDLERLAERGVSCRPEPSAALVRFAGRAFDPLARLAVDAAASAEKDGSSTGWWIVQFVGPIRDDWLGWFERSGFEPVQYLPFNAYLMWQLPRGRGGAKRALGAPFVRWAGPLVSTLKLASAAGAKTSGGRYEALAYHGQDYATLTRRIEASGAHVTHSFKAQGDGRLWTVIFVARPEALRTVLDLPEILWIGKPANGPELAGEMSSSMNAGQVGTAGPLTNYLGFLRDLSLDGSGVAWAVVDSGVDREHPDLRISSGINGPGCETTVPGDDISWMKHGTPVAGLLAGTAATGRADSDGFLYGLGVAPGARLVVHNGLCGLGQWPPAEGWESLSRAILEAGAVGMNNSWFSGTSDQQGYDGSARAMDVMVRDGIFATDGAAEPCPMVFAAGNSGPEPRTLRPPNHAKNIISVGALQGWRLAGDMQTMTDFSSRGPTLDGRIVPTLVAPGEAVTTTVHRDLGTVGDLWLIDGTDGLYTMFEGTSAAAPHVSGSLAVIGQWWRRRHGGKDPSPAMDKALLVNGAVDLDDGDPIPNFAEGWGRVDLGRVVDPDIPMFYEDQHRVLRDTGETWSAVFEVADPSQPLKITLAWTDAPAAPEADPALVNDLDLEVVTGGRTYRGNAFADGWSVEGGTRDNLNNIENIFVASPGTTAAIRVLAAHLPGDGVPFNGDLTDQDFALVCRNCVPPPPPVRRISRRRAPVVMTPIQVNVNEHGENVVGDAANEPTLAVDPDDPSHLVVAWRQFDDVSSPHRTAGWATSEDGGCTWHYRGAIGGQEFRSDPVLAPMGNDGFAFVTLPYGFEEVELFVSDDGGWSWSGARPGLGGDKPWMTSDPDRDALYLAWSDYPSCCEDRIFTRSLDGGLTFEQPVEIPGTPTLGTLAVGVDGEIYLAGLQDDWTFGVARADEPFDLDRPLDFETTAVDLGGVFPLVDSPNPGGLISQIWVAADRSYGPFRGSVYLLSTIDPPGPDPVDVMISRSDDRGASWTPPVPVFVDSSATWQWFPTLSVSSSGRVDVAFVHVPDPSRPEVNEIRFASSSDGGQSWSPARAVSDRFNSHLGWPAEQQKIGDYYHLVSVNEGAYLVFAATFNGEQDIYILRLGMAACEQVQQTAATSARGSGRAATFKR